MPDERPGEAEMSEQAPHGGKNIASRDPAFRDDHCHRADSNNYTPMIRNLKTGATNPIQQKSSTVVPNLCAPVLLHANSVPTEASHSMTMYSMLGSMC